MNQSERLRDMLRDDVAPRLRDAGFRGSGQRFELPDDVEWRLVAFQRSMFNDGSSVEFTVNLARFEKRDWEAQREHFDWLRPKPTGMGSWPGGRGIRIGHLLPGGGDRWWRIDAGVNAQDIGREVADAIASVGRAWLVGTARHPAER